MDEFDNPKVIAALITAFISLIVAIFTYFTTRKNQKDIEQFKYELNNRSSDLDARRAYNYEALKRLYSEYEPLRFRTIEACDLTLHTIRQISKLSLPNSIPDKYSNGAIPKGNYLKKSMIYQVLLPCVYFKLIQSKLTLVDFEISRPSYLQFLIVKHACLMLTKDSSVASFCRLDYSPYVKDWRVLREENPCKFRRQGFAKGRFENALSYIIVNEYSDSPRVLSFGEFEEKLDTAELGVNTNIGSAVDLFDNFSPDKRPVLWRILLCQVAQYSLFSFAAKKNIEDIPDLYPVLEKVKEDLVAQGISKEVAIEVFDYVNNVILKQIEETYST